jgi:hypothetical protein
MNCLALLKPLPHFASVAAVGLSATISSSDLPCFFLSSYFVTNANQQIRIEGKLGFVVNGAMPRGIQTPSMEKLRAS